MKSWSLEKKCLESYWGRIFFSNNKLIRLASAQAYRLFRLIFNLKGSIKTSNQRDNGNIFERMVLDQQIYQRRVCTLTHNIFVVSASKTNSHLRPIHGTSNHSPPTFWLISCLLTSALIITRPDENRFYEYILLKNYYNFQKQYSTK